MLEDWGPLGVMLVQCSVRRIDIAPADQGSRSSIERVPAHGCR
jgi:hypothetical protein